MPVDLLSGFRGWVGNVLLLGAYALVPIRKLDADSITSQLLSLLGSGLFIVKSAHCGANRSVGVNVVRVGIAIFATLGCGIGRL